MKRTRSFTSSLRRAGNIFAAATLIVGLLSLSYGSMAYADTAAATSVPLGADVNSWNCGGGMPKGQYFGVVGVNDSSTSGAPAFTTNPCLLSEIRWAEKTPVTTKGQPKLQFLIMPADPGNASKYWPTVQLTNVLGTCKIVNGKGENTPPCAFRYGETLASYDTEAVKDENIPTGNPYWVFVSNQIHLTWSSQRMNDAVLDGIATYLKSTGSRVGIESTPAQWNAVAGSFTQSQFSALYGLDNWTGTTSSITQAQNFCKNPSTHIFDHGNLNLVNMINSATPTSWDLPC